MLARKASGPIASNLGFGHHRSDVSRPGPFDEGRCCNGAKNLSNWLHIQIAAEPLSSGQVGYIVHTWLLSDLIACVHENGLSSTSLDYNKKSNTKINSNN